MLGSVLPLGSTDPAASRQAAGSATFVPAARRLLALALVGAAATGGALVVSGRLEERPVRLASVLVAALLAVAALLLRRDRAGSAPAAAGSGGGGRMSLKDAKLALAAILAIGAAAFLGGRGTFATFTAETGNLGSSVSSGTLTLSDTVANGVACVSANGTTQDNVNTACDAVLALTNLAPAVASANGAAKLTIANTGSVDAAKLYLSAPWVNAKLNAGLTSGVAIASLTVSSLEGPVSSGDTLVLSWGTHTQTCTATGNVAAGATPIPVSCNPANANFSYPVGTRVEDTSSNTTASNTDCWDTKTTTSPVGGATKGTDLNFNPAAGNPLCTTALLWVQETTGGKNYCWVGKGSSPEDAAGLCSAPIAVDLGAGLTNGNAVASLTVSALNGNVRSGDTVAVTEGDNTLSCTASANAAIGATAIPVASCTPNANYTTAARVTDATVQAALDADVADTISAFDRAWTPAARLVLPPVSADGTVNAAAAVHLAKNGDAGASRVFWVGVYFPGTGATQNQLQGLQSSFGLAWHIDQ